MDDQLRLRAAELEAGGAGAFSQGVRERALARKHHGLALASTRLRRLLVIGAVRAVGVRVPALPGLPPERAGRHHPRLQDARLPAGLAEALVVERARDLVSHVDAHQVHQLERTHPEAPAEARDAVDL